MNKKNLTAKVTKENILFLSNPKVCIRCVNKSLLLLTFNLLILELNFYIFCC